MPSGKFHALATTALAGVSLATCFMVGAPQVITLGIISGLILTPDLDVDNGSLALSIVRKAPKDIIRIITKSRTASGIALEIGKLLSDSYRLFWRRYAVDQKHRGCNIRKWQVSHAPIIGTLDRVVYIFFGSGWGSLALWFIWRSASVNIGSAALLVSGLAMADALHIVMDIISTKIKTSF